MGNPGEEARDRTQSRKLLPANLARVNDAAKRSRQTRFTALLHHVDVEALGMHQRVRDHHMWLAAVLRGHYAYFGIPGNSSCLGRFRLQVMKAWRRVLLRRSQRPKLSWERFNAILKVFPIPSGRVHGWRHQMA